jgi:cellulose synthase/poly-beta-1,6-N-acetylglucosamine synthase-like glycosyltransferase
MADIITYILLFLSLNFEVFMLITYFENKHKIKEEDAMVERGLKKYPSVTVIVPCWNEEKTVSATVHSILNMDYPKDQLKIIIVDDGSTDSTWNVIQKFSQNPQISLYTKQNGGKYTALNLGLSKTTTELVGCLDADSFADKNALKTVVTYFQDKETMAVAPSIKLWKPKGVLQLLQKVEYGFGIFTRKLFHYMNAVYITPGPLSIFRREVFENLGPYRHAHGTEDIDIALRMQKNHYKIVHAHSAIIYTVAPKTLRSLLKQRVRWSYGFIKNAFDNRDMFFKPQYGNLGMFILPMASISIGSVISVFTIAMGHFIQTLVEKYIQIKTIGWNLNLGHYFDWFYVDTQILSILAIATFIGSLAIVLSSRKMSEGHMKIGWDLIYYMMLYIFIAPLWIGKAVYNTIFSVKTTWR